MSTPSEFLAAALDFAARGVAIFPCNADKEPLTPHGFYDATVNPETIRQWWNEYPDALVGAPTGSKNKFAVVDLDVKDGRNGFDAVPDWEKRSSVISLTANDGAHLFFEAEGAPRCSTSIIAPGVDVRGEGGYVILPPSPGYRWKNGSDFAALPPWPDDLRPAREDDATEHEANGDLIGLSGEVAAALAVLPNPPELGRDAWIRIGMATRAATGGSQQGFEAFDAWSKKWPGYDAEHTRKAWRGFRPARIGAGTIFHMATEADPEWRDNYWLPFVEHGGEVMAEWRKAGSYLQREVTPVDLWASFPPPELPTGLLPDVIERYARAQARTMGADVAGLAMGALTVCAAAISDSIQLQVKKHSEHWTESARLWTALVGDPSTKKSPIMRIITAALTRIDRWLHGQYVAKLLEWQALPTSERGKPPPHPRVRLEDVTIEAAQDIFRDSPDGLLCLQDELSGWFGAMDKYTGNRGAANDRGFWLQTFNGAEYPVDRVGRGSYIIPNLSMCLLGGIQPDPMRRVAADTVDDGLIQRLCPIVLQPATVGRDEPDEGEWKVYDDLVDGLYQMPTPNFVLRFDDEAQEIRNKLEQKHLDLAACEAINKKLGAHIGKFDGIFARLCVLWHCIENVDRLPPIVTADTARRVAEFMHTFMLPHAVSFYAGVLGLSDDHDRLSAVAGYILAHKLDVVTRRDIQRGDRTMRNLTRRDTDRVFEQLEALGWLIEQPGPRPSSASHWRVNPKVHGLFAERGVQEKQRRERIRAAIAEAGLERRKAKGK